MAQGKSRRIARVEIVNNGSAPDVDSDFNTEIRENALAYVTDLYGHDKVSNIITFDTLAAKGAVKAMCNIYSIPFSQANKIAALVPAPIEGRDCSLAEIYDPDSERYDEAADFRAATSTPEWEPIIAGARNIEGRNKSTGVHACGIVISAKPLHDVIPLQVRQKDGRVVSQWTYPELEEMGLIKMDFLGLDTVDLIQHSVEYIRQSGKVPPNMMHLVHGDMDDAATLKLFQDGNTIGIFQFGSEMVRNLLKSMKPTTFNDLSACTAVARPGPMNMLSHVKYADRKNGREEVDFIHPAFKGTPMEDILGDTFGLCVPRGTPVLNSTTGLHQPIETMVPGTLTPSYNHTTGQMEPKAVAHLIHTGVKDTVRIRLNGNRELHLSTTHPVLTGRGYVRAGELTPDDRVQMVDPGESALADLAVVLEVVDATPEDCYDIEVEDNHNFVVSRAIVHNCVYQEQIIRIASDIAGMTLQEGDDLRKAMGKKKMKVMMAMRPKFFHGAMANGYPEEAVTTLWDTIAEFAKYGFNKSHSVAYAMNSYQTAWLKTHHPVEFMAALIAQNVGDKKKTLSFLREANRMGISVGTVDVNLSSERVAPDFARTSGKDILFGLGGVSNVSADAAGIVVRERGKNGLFRSVQDFVNRCMPLGLVNRKVIESLAMAGAFDSFGVSRRSVVEEATKLMGGVKTKVAQGNSLFDDFEDAEDPTEIPLDGPEYPHTLKLQHEADMVGLYLTGHPLEHTGRFGNGTTIAKLLKSSRNTTVSTVASIIEIEKKSSRNGSKSYILSIDDGTDYMTARLSPEMVRSLDKYTAQQAIRKAFEEGDVEVAREFRSLALNPEVAPQEDLTLNTVYAMEVSFRPGKGDNPYNARITAMRPLVLADDGRLPVRLRFKVKGDNESQMRTLLTALPRNLGQKLPGPYPIHVVLHGNLRRASTRQDNIYRAALDEMDLDLSQGRHPRAEVQAWQEAEAQETQSQVTLGGGTGQKKARARAKKDTGPLRPWPPATGDATVPLAQSPADIAEAVETLNYHNSGFTTAKTQAVVNAIEKYLPAENYDFGIFDPSILD